MSRQRLLVWLTLITSGLVSSAQAQLPERLEYEQHIRPILETLCFDCHGNDVAEGGLSLEALGSQHDRQLWGKVWENLLAEMMPPADMPQPSAVEKRTLSHWIGQTVFQLDPTQPDPGRVTIRRLNREEYRNAVQDLFGIEFPVEDFFPADDTGYGFDTIGDVLTIPPTLMDKYFDAAASISDRLFSEVNKPLAERSAAYRQIFGKTEPPTDPIEQQKQAREIIQSIATPAFRQPPDEATLAKLLNLNSSLVERGSAPFHEQVCRAIEAILVSPRFLYRAEFQPRPDDPQNVHRLDEYDLAARLSFSLWSSLPDETLLQLAKEKRLRADLAGQVKRMLQDPKSARFVENFVGQWLQIRDVTGIHLTKSLHRLLRNLREPIQNETLQLFTHVMRKDRDVIELIAADYSFLNEGLADLYGIPDIQGDELRLVNFAADSPRGGILTHASVLMVTSNPDRTSPVKRGLFVLENILGTPSPPAPPDVPALEDSRNREEKLSLRELLERHRADPGCASCHDRMDPPGLGLENFDVIGRWREEEDGQKIDASSQLASGESFSNVRELRQILKQKRRLFYRCLTKKLMTYALGRGIEYTDIPVIEQIVDAMMVEDHAGERGRFSTMLLGILESPQFQMRRGNDREHD